MYKCFNCGSRFEDPDYLEICWEDEYSVGSMFERRTYSVIPTCPHCDSYEIEEFDEEDEYEPDE